MFVGMQTAYILWTWVVEGRPRATISALFMFTFRGILGYSTQLPLPEVNFYSHNHLKQKILDAQLLNTIPLTDVKVVSRQDP